MARISELRALPLDGAGAINRAHQALPAVRVDGRVVDGPKPTLRRRVEIWIEGPAALLELAFAASDARAVSRHGGLFRRARSRADQILEAADELERMAGELRALVDADRHERSGADAFSELRSAARADRNRTWARHAGLEQGDEVAG